MLSCLNQSFIITCSGMEVYSSESHIHIVCLYSPLLLPDRCTFTFTPDALRTALNTDTSAPRTTFYHSSTIVPKRLLSSVEVKYKVLRKRTHVFYQCNMPRLSLSNLNTQYTLCHRHFINRGRPENTWKLGLIARFWEQVEFIET